MHKICKISFLIFITLILINGCATLEQRRMDKEGALDATRTWFKYLDELNYEKLWEISSDLRKLATKKEDFVRATRSMREPMGKMLERNLQVNDKAAFIQYYPDGEYRRIVYWSKYEKKDFAREYLLVVKEGEQWRVLEYLLL